MKVLGARVEWYEPFANDPNLEILVDEIPDTSALVYKELRNLYFAEDPETGIVQFFAYRKPGMGYGGTVFNIPVMDMEQGAIVQKKLIGPWSSRSAVMNCAGFTPSIECTLYKEGWDSLGHGTSITVAKAREIIAEHITNVLLIKAPYPETGEYEPEQYILVLNDGRLKPNQTPDPMIKEEIKCQTTRITN